MAAHIFLEQREKNEVGTGRALVLEGVGVDGWLRLLLAIGQV